MNDPIKDGLSLEEQFEFEQQFRDLTSGDWDRAEKAWDRVRESDRRRGVRKASPEELARIKGMGMLAWSRYMGEIVSHEQKAD